MSYSAKTKTPKLDRVAARVPEDVKHRWQSAATMRGQTLTDFLIVAANAATTETFAEHEKIELSQKDQIKLAEMLLDPPKINDAMRGLLLRYMPGSEKI
jgi:uncharacterized protein (DUF1778 family)